MRLAWVLLLAVGWLSEQTVGAVELRELSVFYRRYHESARLLEIPGFQAKEGLSLVFRVDLFGPVYWNNEVTSLTDSGGYRYVSWRFSFGVRVHRNISLFAEHYSAHLLDHSDSAYQPWGKFPQSNSAVVLWHIWQTGAPERTVF